MLLLRLSKSDSLSSPSQKISKSIGENPLPSDRLTLCTFPFGMGDAPMTNTHVGVLDAVTSSLVFEPLRSSGNKTQERNQDTGSNDGHDDASNQTKVGVGNEEVGK